MSELEAAQQRVKEAKTKWRDAADTLVRATHRENELNDAYYAARSALLDIQNALNYEI